MGFGAPVVPDVCRTYAISEVGSMEEEEEEEEEEEGRAHGTLVVVAVVSWTAAPVPVPLQQKQQLVRLDLISESYSSSTR